MQVRIALLLVPLFILLALPSSHAVVGWSPEDLVMDDFDNDTAGRNPAGWYVKDMPGYEISVDPTISAVGDKSVKIRSALPGYAAGEMWRLFQPTVAGALEFDVRFAENETRALTVRLRTNELPNGLQINFGYGYLRYYDGEWHEVTNITKERWYRVKLVFDASKSSYDIYLDGAKIRENARFFRPASYIDAIAIDADSGHISTSWLDSVRVYTDWPEKENEMVMEILQPYQYPALVKNGDEVSVMAYVAGLEAPVKKVELVWRKDPWGEEGNETIDMRRIRGGVYMTTAPISPNPAGVNVYYTVRAEDGRGNVQYSETHSYEVHRTLPPWLTKPLLLGIVLILPFFL